MCQVQPILSGSAHVANGGSSEQWDDVNCWTRAVLPIGFPSQVLGRNVLEGKVMKRL